MSDQETIRLTLPAPPQPTNGPGPWLIRIVGAAFHLGDGFTEPARYVAHYDPDGCYGMGRVEVTYERTRALRFGTAEEAHRFCQQTSTVRPTRADGFPNRPLTAYTIMLERIM